MLKLYRFDDRTTDKYELVDCSTGFSMIYETESKLFSFTKNGEKLHVASSPLYDDKVYFKLNPDELAFSFSVLFAMKVEKTDTKRWKVYRFSQYEPKS